MNTNNTGGNSATRISAVILAKNEEANIRYCLETLTWCDEIIVADMESSDRTSAIAREYTDKVYTCPPTPAFDIAKKFAVEKASGDWIFIIDADEMVPKGLALALRAAADKREINVVDVPFNHYIMGAKIRRSGWGYTPQPRFFRRGKVVLSGRVHGYLRKAEEAVSLALPLDDGNSIVHFNYTDSAHFVRKMNTYTDLEAERLSANGARFTYRGLLSSSVSEFCRRFISEKGYSEGPRGFSLSLMMAFYRALSFIKLWEKQESVRESVPAVYERERRAILAGWGK